MDYYFGVRNLTSTANDAPTAHVDGYDPELAEAIFHQLTGADIRDVLLRAQVCIAGCTSLSVFDEPSHTRITAGRRQGALPPGLAGASLEGGRPASEDLPIC